MELGSPPGINDVNTKQEHELKPPNVIREDSVKCGTRTTNDSQLEPRSV